MPGKPLHAAQRLCPRGVGYFEQLPGVEPRAWMRGATVALDKAILEAARILHGATAPGILGLELVTIETCEAAVRLAAQLRAWVCPLPSDPTGTWGQLAPDLALSRAEYEEAADLVIFIGGEPEVLQPRQRERHLRRGLGEGRRILLLSVSTLAEATTLRLHFETLEPLPEALTPLADAIKAARCVQVFFENELVREQPEMARQWQALAARQRQHRRFGLAVLGSSGRGRTATDTLTWMTGYPGPIHFSAIKPDFRPCVGEAEALLARGGLDTVLWLGVNQQSQLPTSTGATIRVIHISAQPDPDADVAIQVPGLDPRLDGHVIREDGIVLRLAGAAPGIADPTPIILEHIRSALRELAA